jgi:hypothetical protein
LEEVWIGLAEVIAVTGTDALGKAKGAFVNVVAWANSGEHFHSKVETMATRLDLRLLGLEDVEPFSKRSVEKEVDDQIFQMADTARDNPADVVFGTFHLWNKTDA